MRGSLMLRHDELAFIKAISTLHNKLSTTGRRRVSAVRRAELACNRKANDLASSSGSAEPAN